MIDFNSSASCTRSCWIIAGLLGVLAFLLALTTGHRGFFTALFLGALVVIGLGVLLNWLFCQTNVAPRSTASAATPSYVSPTPASAASANQAAPIETATAADASQSTTAAATTASDTAVALDNAADEAASADTAEAEDAPKSTSAAASAQTTTESKATESNEAESKASAKKNPAKKAPAKQSKSDGTAKTKTAKPKAPAPTSVAQSDAAAPAGLDAARDGGPDNLKQIKGVGPVLEKMLHSLGYFHFDQIAAWGPEEAAWIDENVKGARGRVTRDNWVDQAKTLAAGGTTEFSARVKKGDVY